MKSKIGDIWYFNNKVSFDWEHTPYSGFYYIAHKENAPEDGYDLILAKLPNGLANWRVNIEFLKKYFTKVNNNIPNILYGKKNEN